MKFAYHLYAKFPSNGVAVRIGVFFTERSAQLIGNEIFLLADEVYYKARARTEHDKPYRKPKHMHARGAWEAQRP